ncbi:RNA-binding S4 domain-containing protein [Hephaestia sp. GCM10023244]|uniref:RNA-binding S4 domain-containing protein n=2 Tax=unclassified Hephaestia TaxID=2631281 RepID=UPI00360FECC1
MADAALAMRLDRFLWFVRIARTRSVAGAIAASGHLRLDGRPVARAAAPVRIGNILTFPTPRGEIRVVRVVALPARRGPASEARTCYEDLTPANVSQQAPGH